MKLMTHSTLTSQEENTDVTLICRCAKCTLGRAFSTLYIPLQSSLKVKTGLPRSETTLLPATVIILKESGRTRMSGIVL